MTNTKTNKDLEVQLCLLLKDISQRAINEIMVGKFDNASYTLQILIQQAKIVDQYLGGKA